MTAFEDWTNGVMVLEAPTYGNGAHIHAEFLAYGPTILTSIATSVDGTGVYADLPSRLNGDIQKIRQKAHDLISRWLTLATNEDATVELESVTLMQELSDTLDENLYALKEAEE